MTLEKNQVTLCGDLLHPPPFWSPYCTLRYVASTLAHHPKLHMLPLDLGT